MSNAASAHQLVATSDQTYDSLTDLLNRQTEILKGSRWYDFIKALPHSIAWRIHSRMEELQRERPLTGVQLKSRCGGVKTTILYEIAGNRKWGRSRLASRRAKTQYSRRYNPYKDAMNQRLANGYHTATGSDTDA